MRVSFPDKLRVLFTKSRYKVIVGGRGKGASWNIARALLLLAANQTLRILCCREVQKSIKESVHQLLKEQIPLVGHEDQYEVLETEIKNSNTGSQFLFIGLQDHTAQSVKSYENFDIAWVAEAQAVKKKSLDILIPTIRKEGSEIWVDMNPELDTDDAYMRLVVNAPPDAQVIPMTFADNPWFPATLELERAYCEKMYPDDYRNIWLGEPMTSVPGAIYAKELLQLMKEQRYTFCPYDSKLKVHTIWDMGWNDAMAIILVQKAHSEVRIIAYYEGSFKRVDEWAADLNLMKMNWGWDYLPHDGYAESRKTGNSDADILKANGRRVKPKGQSVPLPHEIDPEQGIRITRTVWPKLIINKGGPGIDRFLECAKRFARNIPKSTGEPAVPIKNEFKHGMDALRHLALVADKLTNDTEPLHAPLVPPYRPRDKAMGTL